MNTNSKIKVLLTSTLMLLAGGQKVNAQTNNSETGLPPNLNDPPTVPNNTSNSPLPNGTNNLLPTNSVNSAPPIDQPPNINNTNINNPDSYSTNYPNCSGTCVFAIGRNDRQNGWQITTGVIWNINSPERTQAESSKIVAIAQSQKINLDSNLLLMEKLTQAIVSDRTEQANGLAIILANRLGYLDYKSLIKEIKRK
jgi:hypothetical protein